MHYDDMVPPSQNTSTTLKSGKFFAFVLIAAFSAYAVNNEANKMILDDEVTIAKRLKRKEREEAPYRRNA